MILYKAYDALYFATVYLVAGCSFNDCKKIMKTQLKCDDLEWGDFSGMSGGSWTISIQERGAEEVHTVFVVWMRRENDLETLIHESLHLALRIFHRSFMCPIPFEYQEPFAYYATYWVMRFWDYLKKHKKKGGKNG